MGLIILSIGMKTAKNRGGLGIYTCKYQGSNIKHNRRRAVARPACALLWLFVFASVQCLALEKGEKALLQLEKHFWQI